MKDLAITNCRVSSDEQLKNNSLNRQRDSVIKAARKLDVEIPRDGQWSGSVSSKRGNNYERKDIKEMLSYCKKHQRVKYLIIDEPDRFMRSIKEAYYWEGVFEHQVGVKIYYACDEQLNTDDMAAKMLRFTKYFAAESSNEERHNKSIAGDRKAIEEGRYPFHPKLGYMKGDKAGVHKLAPGIGDLMKNILAKLSSGLISLTESLQEYNNSDYVQHGKHCSYKMDKWRNIVIDEYYCGVVSIGKQVNARNEHGLHEAIITRSQHEKIVEIVSLKNKNQNGPRKNGNPDFPLNTITLCEKCYKKELSSGKVGRRNKGKFVGFKHGNGRTNKVYKRYRCRVCGRSITRDELHGAVKDYLDNLDFTDNGRKELEKKLSMVWRLERERLENDSAKLKRKKITIEREIGNLIGCLSRTDNRVVAEQIEKKIELRQKELEETENRITDIQDSEEQEKDKFIEFALEFADNLGSHFFELTPLEVKEFKLLLFPDGFFINSEGKVYTTKISPFYRLRETKKTPESVNLDLMVRLG